jgi:hypothetical protein
MLATYARMRFYQKQKDTTNFVTTAAEWQEWLGKLTIYVEFPPDYVPIPGRLSSDGIGWNNLGGAYPADWRGI